jgi:predicted ribonuclease YlaK
VPVEVGPRIRPSDADEEILVLCAELVQLTNVPVTLITGDTAMRLRARAQGTAVVSMPDNYLRVRDDKGASPPAAEN